MTSKKEQPIESAVRPILTPIQEKEIFMDLQSLSTAEAGRKHGLDFYYNDNTKLRFAVHAVYKKVLAAPGLYGLTTDDTAKIQEAVSSRSMKNNPQQKSLMEREMQDEFKGTIEGIRNEAASLLRRKLGKIKTNKELDGVSFRDLKDVLAMAVDKARLVTGQSTENVVQFSKIDPEKTTPQEALAIILKAREALVESRN